MLLEGGLLKAGCNVSVIMSFHLEQPLCLHNLDNAIYCLQVVILKFFVLRSEFTGNIRHFLGIDFLGGSSCCS